MEPVDQPGDERRLRPNDDEVRSVLLGEPDDALEILRGDVAALGDLLYPSVAGRGYDLLDARALRELPRERVLPPSSPDEQYAGQAASRVCSRDGPTETMPTGTSARAARRSRYLRAAAGRSAMLLASASASLHPSISS
jgi:hypothetical protein